jgi:hypothetical protein
LGRFALLLVRVNVNLNVNVNVNVNELFFPGGYLLYPSHSESYLIWIVDLVLPTMPFVVL